MSGARFVVFVSGNVSRAALSCRPKKRLVQPVARPVCVNALRRRCTARSRTSTTPRCHRVHQARGARHTMSTSKACSRSSRQNGMRKVIGKGYKCATDMQHDVPVAASSARARPVPRRCTCILKASTGTRSTSPSMGFAPVPLAPFVRRRGLRLPLPRRGARA